MQTTQPTPIDLLQIKIEKAKAALPADTISAISTVDWKAAILGLRGKHGYSFEQLGDLELETELLLCGLLTPEDYPKELENRMKISSAQANELVNEMNDLVFKKIREELIKNIERKKVFAGKIEEKKEAGEKTHPILMQKFSDSFKLPMKETEHTLNNISKTNEVKNPVPQSPSASSYPPKGDPYRLSPDE